MPMYNAKQIVKTYMGWLKQEQSLSELTQPSQQQPILFYGIIKNKNKSYGL